MPLLPLFPLDLVLLPGAALPLHIFEPRYKEMIGECLSNKTPFGVVRSVEHGIASIGCTAEILEVINRYADGRLDISTRGLERFEVLQVDRERSFLRGEVRIVPDEPGDAAEEDMERALHARKEILSLAGASPDAISSVHRSLSFQLAASLPLNLEFKQKLLSTLSERDRVRDLANYLEDILPRLRSAARAREKAGGNGHAH